MRGLNLATGLLALTLATSTITLAQHHHQQSFSLPTQDARITFASTSQDATPTASFVGQQVVRITTTSSQQHQALVHQAHSLGLDVWSAKIGAACGQDGGYGCMDIRMASDTHNEDPSRASATPDHLMDALLSPFDQDSRPMVTTLIHDLDSVIASQRRRVPAEEASMAANTMQAKAWHKNYHTFDEITDYMRMLEQSYPSHAKVIQIGSTHEGRPILALKISNGLPTDPQPSPEPPTEPPSEPEPEPQPDPPFNISASAATASGKLGIVITGGSHAREWISTSTSLFFASDLLQAAFGNPHPPPPSPPSSAPSRVASSPDDDSSTSSSPFSLLKKGKKNRKGRKKKPTRPRNTWSKSSARAVLSTFEITVIPVSNPDGYVYSWEKNRMWRKNRQPNRFPGGLFCKGVDLNRNWAYAFSSPSSTSLNPCSEMYGGSSPFSAEETRAIGRYLENPVNNVRGFFDLHSYGQLMMYPFSWSCEESVADEEDLLELSLGAISALKNVHGRQFTAGKICQVYAQSGGNSVDWSYAGTNFVDGGGEGKRKIKWSFSIELRDGGTYGFLLPPQQIVPASQEVSAALAYMLNFIAKKDSR